MSTQPTDTAETRSTAESRSTTDDRDERDEPAGAPMTFAPDDETPIPGLFESERNQTPF